MNLSSLPSPTISGGPYVMGVLNLTPDSFFDGGRWTGEDAVRHALSMIQHGADLIDVGGESTRPGAAPVEAREEIDRVTPIIRSLRAQTDKPIAIDTMKPAVALAAFAAGATIWNDVMALRAPGALETAAQLKAPVILMHMKGEPRTMQSAPHYDDVVAEVIAFLKSRIADAERYGVTELWVDPGLGFGKTLEHNLALMNATARIRAETGKPLLFGASRKSFIAKIDGAEAQKGRLGGSMAAALIAAQNGADMVRVHDVSETVQALKVWRAVKDAPNQGA
jgi:dihydropteroate synthase